MRRAPSSVMAFVQPGEPEPLAASLCWVRWSPPTNTVGSGIDDARRPLPWQSTRSGKENECKGEASTMWRQERGYSHLFVSVRARCQMKVASSRGLTFTSRELKLNQRRRDQATVLYGCMLSGV